MTIDAANGIGIGSAPAGFFHVNPQGTISNPIYKMEGITSAARGVEMTLTNTNTTTSARGFELSPTMNGSAGAAGIGINPQLDPVSNASVMYGVLNLVSATNSTFDITNMQDRKSVV